MMMIIIIIIIIMMSVIIVLAFHLDGFHKRSLTIINRAVHWR